MAFKDDEERRAYYREYNKGWYQLHRESILEKRKRHKEELRKWLWRYKSKLCCMECGENHPACLQFHHRNREEKSFTIGSILGRRLYMSINKLEKEISKCDILCGNCHALRHWRETHDFDDWREAFLSVDEIR